MLDIALQDQIKSIVSQRKIGTLWFIDGGNLIMNAKDGDATIISPGEYADVEEFVTKASGGSYEVRATKKPDGSDDFDVIAFVPKSLLSE